MHIYIKNMVCGRCVAAVKNILETSGLKVAEVSLGEAETESSIPPEKLKEVNNALHKLGFELINDRKSRIIEQIKTEIVNLVHHSGEAPATNLSTWLAEKLHYDYTYLSNLFSEVEGTTIEKYYIAQRIEKVKELLVYDELTLSEIAHTLGYSSTAYLSSQFKKVTGLTPSFYKSVKDNKRRNIDQL
ncbi:AraC family transcriptional regulator [Flavobacterium cyanobacteriorum]|uniref:AraC family transcriptional regulator n=1 Tax=Flavobacterium cyanobacteriorum TaxID=2022802 RepID=A0A255Z949_9FLAO|nr:helix-turn-helix domain-containing protein [Flavobacterium cyanobacteriorum]OYQ37976.1 AraC family transcriptional regulator [Flavobacterium cyanobacteriorum]